MELQVAPQKGSPVDENWHFVGKMNIDIINYHQIILNEDSSLIKNMRLSKVLTQVTARGKQRLQVVEADRALAALAFT